MRAQPNNRAARLGPPLLVPSGAGAPREPRSGLGQSPW